MYTFVQSNSHHHAAVLRARSHIRLSQCAVNMWWQIMNGKTLRQNQRTRHQITNTLIPDY